MTNEGQQETVIQFAERVMLPSSGSVATMRAYSVAVFQLFASDALQQHLDDIFEQYQGQPHLAVDNEPSGFLPFPSGK